MPLNNCTVPPATTSPTIRWAEGSGRHEGAGRRWAGSVLRQRREGNRQDCGGEQEVGPGPRTCARSKPCYWAAWGSPRLLGSMPPFEILVQWLEFLLHYPDKEKSFPLPQGTAAAAPNLHWMLCCLASLPEPEQVIIAIQVFVLIHILLIFLGYLVHFKWLSKHQFAYATTILLF